MDTRRWCELAAALLLGMLIGYWVAPDAPSARYRVGSWADANILYRYDAQTGKTWWMMAPANGWKEIAEPNQVVSPPNEE